MKKTKGNQLDLLLKDKKFDEAKKYIEQSDSLESPIKNYNLGVVALKEGKLPLARYHFELAKKEGLYSTELDNAMLKTKQDLGISSVEVDLPLSESVMLTSLKIQPDVYLAIAALAGVIFSFAIFKRKLITSVVSGIIGLLFVGFTFGFVEQLDKKVIFEEAVVYHGPSRIFEQIQKIPAGLTVITEKQKGDWVKVIYPSDYKGWVYKIEAKNL